MGDDAGGGQARRRHHPDHRRCSAPPTWPTASPGAAPRLAIADAETPPKCRVDAAGEFGDAAPASCRSPPSMIAQGGMSRPPAGTRYADAYDVESAAPFTPGTDGRRPAAALLHLRHHRAGPSWSSTPRVVPGRPPVDDVLDRAAAPATSTCNISSPGWAKHAWSLLLRAVDRRGDDLRLQLRPLRRGRADGADATGAGSPRSARRRRCGGC